MAGELAHTLSTTATGGVKGAAAGGVGGTLLGAAYGALAGAVNPLGLIGIAAGALLGLAGIGTVAWVAALAVPVVGAAMGAVTGLTAGTVGGSIVGGVMGAERGAGEITRKEQIEVAHSQMLNQGQQVAQIEREAQIAQFSSSMGAAKMAQDMTTAMQQQQNWQERFGGSNAVTQGHAAAEQQRAAEAATKEQVR